MCCLTTIFWGWNFDFSILKMRKLGFEGLGKVTQLESGSVETHVQVCLTPDPGLSHHSSLPWATCLSNFLVSVSSSSALPFSAPPMISRATTLTQTSLLSSKHVLTVCWSFSLDALWTSKNQLPFPENILFFLSIFSFINANIYEYLWGAKPYSRHCGVPITQLTKYTPLILMVKTDC